MASPFLCIFFSKNFPRILGTFMGIVFGSGAVDKKFSKNFSKNFPKIFQKIFQKFLGSDYFPKNFPKIFQEFSKNLGLKKLVETLIKIYLKSK